ncbi:MAG TPA: helix-turn-helix domain-containing protein [Acetobacteraceae bacterium]|jgi:AcrR family transcriptional regulator
MPSEIANPPAISRAPQRQRGRDRVAALMAAGAALFVERGYDATTMTEIAARAGASIGSLYLFFPIKQALAQAMLTGMGDALSARLDALRARTEGCSAAELADALFGELALFLAAHPVYAVLIDLPGEDGWKHAVRARRRAQIAALFAQARPALPAGQAERLAVIVPQLMRITMTLSGEPHPLRDEVLDELRAMLRHHLEWPAQGR